jgi:hypothetical protein
MNTEGGQGFVIAVFITIILRNIRAQPIGS